MTFVKGQSGNPAGRPKSEQAITPLLRRMLHEKAGGRTRAENVANALLTAAEDGDQVAIKTVLERVDGKVQDLIDITTDGAAFSFSIQRASDANG